MSVKNSERLKMQIGRVVTLVASIPFLMSSIMKLTGAAEVEAGFQHMGWPASMGTGLGVLELLCVLLYLLPISSVVGAILLTGYIGGAIATHLRIGEPVIVQVALGVLLWLGLYLRDSRLRELLPVRKFSFAYERQIVIARPVAVVFLFLQHLRNFKMWNPFLKEDPAVVHEYRGVDGETGFVFSWKGNQKVGSGEQELTRIIDDKRVEFELRFAKPFAAVNQGYFAVEKVDDRHTKVSWGMTGQYGFISVVMSLFFNMEKMIGDKFSEGLQQLKQVLEKGNG